MDSKLSKYKTYATISRVFIVIAITYLLMVVVKGLWTYTDEPNNRVSSIIYYWTTIIISKTYFFPINYLWDYIPNIGLSHLSVKTLYIVFIPPVAIITISSIYIENYKILKSEKWLLDKEIAKQINIKKGLQQKGYYEKESIETIEIKVDSNKNKDTLWHNKWWGKIVIPLLVLMIATAIGLRAIG